MIGWFSFLFFFLFFCPSLITVPRESTVIDLHSSVSEWKMQNSTTEIQMLSAGFAAVVQQVQANALAQLGSNPFKPHLRATADPTTPSEVQKMGLF